MEPYAAIAEQYADFARNGGESPCFEEWAAGVVGDAAVRGWIATLPPVKHQPNIVFAAARWHGVPAPGPYAALRAALLGDDGTIRSTILTRSTQTNEVGRLATLVPAFAQAAASSRAGGDDRPLALVEVGASAGLNLLPDRWSYRWHTVDGTVAAGDRAAPRLEADVAGPAPLPQAPPEVGWRRGVDLHPLDVTDPDAVAWLENLVWPEQDARRERLRTAVALARREPPVVVPGDLLDLLPAVVEEAAAHGPVVVFHSAVIAYLEEPDRRRFAATMAGLVARGACSWVSNEGPRVLPEVTSTLADPAPPEGLTQGFVLGVDGRAVAWTHGHGSRLHWVGPAVGSVR